MEPREPQQNLKCIALATILAERNTPDENYIKPDPSSTEDHLTKFNKEQDFNLVLRGLKSDKSTQSLLENFNFTASFSRIIRHLLSTASADLCSSTNGEETDMYSIWVLNAIFNTQAKMIVLAGPKTVDPESSDWISVAGGKALYEGVSDVYLRQSDHSEPSKPEFLIIRKNAHFITLS